MVVGIVGLIRAPQRRCGGKLAQGGLLTLLLTCLLTLVTVQSDVNFYFWLPTNRWHDDSTGTFFVSI
jgi:hypothetical protein